MTAAAPYVKDCPCPKCGEVGARTHWTEDGRFYRCWANDHPKGEHFDRYCNNCHYCWPEEVQS